jgi:hypothetical protein
MITPSQRLPLGMAQQVVIAHLQRDPHARCRTPMRSPNTVLAGRDALNSRPRALGACESGDVWGRRNERGRDEVATAMHSPWPANARHRRCAQLCEHDLSSCCCLRCQWFLHRYEHFTCWFKLHRGTGLYHKFTLPSSAALRSSASMISAPAAASQRFLHPAQNICQSSVIEHRTCYKFTLPSTLRLCEHDLNSCCCAVSCSPSST